MFLFSVNFLKIRKAIYVETNHDSPLSSYSKFTISGGLNRLHWMRDSGLLISVVENRFELVLAHKKTKVGA